MQQISNSIAVLVLGAAVLLACRNGTADDAAVSLQQPKFRAALLAANDVTAARLDDLRDDEIKVIVILLEGTSPADRQSQRRAARQVKASNMQLYYWIEVARCPELADAHPEWMASLQVHDEWRRFFPSLR